MRSPEEIAEREKFFAVMLADDEEDARTHSFLTSVLGPHMVDDEAMKAHWFSDGKGYMITFDGGRSNNIDMFLDKGITPEDLENVYIILGYCRLNLIRVSTLMMGSGTTAVHLDDGRLSELTNAKEQAKEAARDAKREAEEPGYLARQEENRKVLFAKIFGEKEAQGLRDLTGQLK